MPLDKSAKKHKPTYSMLLFVVIIDLNKTINIVGSRSLFAVLT